MKKEEIEDKSREIIQYFEDDWPLHSSSMFDKLFSLRNWTTVMASLIIHFSKNKKKEKSDSLEEEYSKILAGKKILQLGCGPGIFLSVLDSLGAKVIGIEPYCSTYENLKIIKSKCQDILKKDSELYKELKNKKFDAIFTQDLFVPTIIFDQKEAYKTISELKNHITKEGIIILEHQNEETFLKKEELEKTGLKAECINSIHNIFNLRPSQIILKI